VLARRTAIRWWPMVERAQTAGIPVTIFDSGISTEKYLS